MSVAGPNVRLPSCGIAVMAKASIPGKTKTRLVPPLTFDEAACFNTAFLKDVAANIAAAGTQTPITCYMAFGPPGSNAFFEKMFPSSVGLIDAWHPVFGDCLFAAIDQVLARGHQSAVVLNSDSPTLPTALLVETARLLAAPGDRAVLGPSIDGGYYLLGIKARHRRLFEDVAWSTEQVARQTLERAAEIGLDTHVLPEWYDVDDIESLRGLRGELIERRAFAPRLQPHAAVHSAELLGGLLACTDLERRLAGAIAPSIKRAAG
ncbi:MAG TPA: TIGR04282 family arsenosugar biosynthesis glycosyltransferase [Xanthobacteraceae bacterium]